jgi:preprotein translocase subunit SecG
MIETPQEPIVDLSSMTHTLAQSTPTLAVYWNPVVTNILVGVFLIVSGAMILLVLIQRPQGGGLSGAFGAGGGGGGAGQTAFGTKTGDVLTGATITIFLLFLITAIVLNFATRPQTPPDPTPALIAPEGESQGDVTEIIEDAQEGDPVSDLIEDVGESIPADEPSEDLEINSTSDETPGMPETNSDEPATGGDQPR